jgi:hypothetical protein
MEECSEEHGQGEGKHGVPMRSLPVPGHLAIVYSTGALEHEAHHRIDPIAKTRVQSFVSVYLLVSHWLRLQSERQDGMEQETRFI